MSFSTIRQSLVWLTHRLVLVTLLTSLGITVPAVSGLGTAATAQAASSTYTMSASCGGSGWCDSGISVSPNYVLTATGTAGCGGNPGTDCASDPNGSGGVCASTCFQPGLNQFALIGYVNGIAFNIGDGPTTPPASGELYVAYNDDYYPDNWGSYTLTATPVTTPGAPTGVTATAGTNQATVSWTAPSNNGGAAISGYTVTSSPGNITATSTGTSATVSGLTAGTRYTFTVTAANSVGTGTASAASNAVIPISTYQSNVLALGPVAYWPLDEPSGSTTMTDIAGNDPGAYGNGYTSPTLGVSGATTGTDTAASFAAGQGVKANNAISTLSGSSARSVSIWFKTTTQVNQSLFEAGQRSPMAAFEIS